MPYFSIQNFKAGLDTRRSELTSVPGALLVAENGHINSGGTFEKRKAFVNTQTLPAGTFGLQPVTKGVVVFGSAINVMVTSPVIYQQLVHPDGVTAMTGIVASTSYGDATWAVAEFADGNVFEYYNGVLVSDFYAGLIWSGGMTSYDLALNLARGINKSTNYTSTLPTLPTVLTFT